MDQPRTFLSKFSHLKPLDQELTNLHSYNQSLNLDSCNPNMNLSMNSKNLLYTKESSNTQQRKISWKGHHSGNIKAKKNHINESTLVSFNAFDPQKVYICNLDMNSIAFEHYNCLIDFDSRQLVTNFKILPLLQVTKP